jgi:hypothetical protein
MHRSRISRIVVRRPGAPGTAFGPAPARCAEDRRDRTARAADVVWRIPRAAERRAETDTQLADRRAVTA